MRVLTYGLVLFFSLPILVLGIYLFLGLYDGIDIIHTFTQDSFLTVLKHSFILSFLSSILSLVMGIVLAKSFYTLQNDILKLLYILVLTVLFMIQPIMILTIAKQITLFGTLNALSQSITIATLHLIPLATLFWITIYRYTQTESLHIAHYIASSRWSTYRYILFPQIRYKIVLAFLFLFILVFIDQEVPSILGYRTYTEELVSQMTLMENMQTIVRSALLSFILVGTLTLGIIFWFKKNPLDFSSAVSSKTTSPEYFGKIMLGILYLSLGFILFILAKASLNLSIQTLLTNNTEVIIQTLVFSFFVSLFTLAVGIFLQYLLQYHSSRMVHIIWISLLLFYLLLPHSLVSLALLDIYQQVGLFSPEGDFILFFVGYMLVLLPIASLLLYLFSITQKKDYFLDFFPISRYHRWIKITLPKLWVVWTIVFLVLMTFALNELSVSILLVPPGFETMIVKIYNLLHYGDKANIAFLSLMQLLFLIGCFVILSLLSKKVSK
jgi:iron(III) transport system permease protein